MEIIYKNPSELHLYDRNPRKNDKSVDLVANSIQEFGFKIPIVIDVTQTIICGHTRVKAAKKLDLTSIPCILADDLTDEQVKAFRLADNKVGELTEWDNDLLRLELDEIDLDMFQFGFSDISDIALPVNDGDGDLPDIDAKSDPVVQRGEVWQLGRHRLMCGDSTDCSDVSKLMDGQVADMVFTDPPYGMKKESEGILNDNLNFDDLLEFNKRWIPMSFDFLKNMGSWYCWGIDEPLMDVYSEILKPMSRKNQIVIRNYITWAKHSAFGMRSHSMLSYPKETEKCWFVVKGRYWQNNNAEFFNRKYEAVLEYLRGAAQKVGLDAKKLTQLTGVQMWGHWFSKSQFTVIPRKHYEALQNEYAKDGAFELSYEDLLSLKGRYNDKKSVEKPHFDCTRFNDGDMPLSDVWRESATSVTERELVGGHATPKPIALCMRAIKTSSRPGECVLDLFGGSGSTLIACERAGRSCFAMELDPRYCDVIIARWENETGQKAVRLNETTKANRQNEL